MSETILQCNPTCSIHTWNARSFGIHNNNNNIIASLTSLKSCACCHDILYFNAVWILRKTWKGFFMCTSIIHEIFIVPILPLLHKNMCILYTMYTYTGYHIKWYNIIDYVADVVTMTLMNLITFLLSLHCALIVRVRGILLPATFTRLYPNQAFISHCTSKQCNLTLWSKPYDRQIYLVIHVLWANI